MTSSAWFTGLLRGNPELYRRIYDWNLYPHRWAPPARVAAVPGLDPALIRLLERTPRGRERLGRHFRSALGLEATCWDFESPVRRIALLPAEALARLASFAGAIQHWMSLSRAVSQRDHQAVIARVGADARTYALRHGRTVLARAALPPLSDTGTMDWDRLVPTGWSVLQAGLSGEPPAVRLRLRLQLPDGLPAVDPIPSHGASALLQALLPEALSAKDRPCFA
jgi:hypothetical protein